MIEYARFADDMVVLVNSDPRHGWLRKAVEKRLREEFAKLEVEVNEEKSRKVDLTQGESFGFLGFEFRRSPESSGAMDAVADAERQEADGIVTQAQGGFPKASLPARARVDRGDQSDLARLGELLCVWPFESVLLVRAQLGGEEGPAPSGPGLPTSRIRLEAVE